MDKESIYCVTYFNSTDGNKVFKFYKTSKLARTDYNSLKIMYPSHPVCLYKVLAYKRDENLYKAETFRLIDSNLFNYSIWTSDYKKLRSKIIEILREPIKEFDSLITEHTCINLCNKYLNSTNLLISPNKNGNCKMSLILLYLSKSDGLMCNFGPRFNVSGGIHGTLIRDVIITESKLNRIIELLTNYQSELDRVHKLNNINTLSHYQYYDVKNLIKL